MISESPIVAIGTVGGVSAAVMGGPLAEVFNETAAVLAIMGAFGGVTRGLAIHLPWKEVLRGVLLGALLAFGFGVLSPELLRRIFAMEVIVGTPAIPVLAAAAFMIGFAQDLVVAWAATRQKKDDKSAKPDI